MLVAIRASFWIYAFSVIISSYLMRKEMNRNRKYYKSSIQGKLIRLHIRECIQGFLMYTLINIFYPLAIGDKWWYWIVLPSMTISFCVMGFLNLRNLKLQNTKEQLSSPPKEGGR